MSWLLKRCGVYSNGYFNYLKNIQRDYYQSKKNIQNKIIDIFHATGGIIGHRQMVIFLAREGIKLSKTTVHKFMNKELKLYCIHAKKRPHYVEGTKHEVFPNHESENFYIDEKIKVWRTDFTCIKGWNRKFRYNFSILDLYYRSVMATKTSRTMTREIAKEILEMALWAQKKRPKGLVLHRD